MQPRTGQWSSDDHINSQPDDERSGQIDPPVRPRRPTPSQTYSQLLAAAPPARPVDPATAAALASIRPAPAPAINRTLLGVSAPPPPPRTSSVPRMSSRTLRGQPIATPSEDPEWVADEEKVDEAPVEAPISGFAPAARHLTPRAGSGGPSAWWGWAAAVVLLVVGLAFYAFGHLPLQRELESAKQASAKQMEQQNAVLAKLQADLARKRSQVEQLTAATPATEPVVAREPPAAKPAVVTHEPAAKPRAVEPPAAHASQEHVRREAAAVAERPAHEADPTASNKGVDRAAAAAATAALEAQVYGGDSTPAPTPSAKPAPEPIAPTSKAAPEEAAPTSKAAPKPAAADAQEARDSLAGVVNSDDDPLQGL